MSFVLTGKKLVSFVLHNNNTYLKLLVENTLVLVYPIIIMYIIESMYL